MRKIIREHDAKAVAKQSHCYLCGQPLDDPDKEDREHVVPKSIFRKGDRNFPLILPAHKKCNGAFSVADEQLKQLISILHGDATSKPIHTRIAGEVVNGVSRVGLVLEGIPLHRLIDRIVRGCHLALYAEILGPETPKRILSPLPAFDCSTGEPLDENFLQQNIVFCGKLKAQRMIGQIDCVHAYKGNFRFESIWAVSDDGLCPFVIACVDIYNWHRLGNQVLGRSQGCVVSYCPASRTIPNNASLVSKIRPPFRFKDLLNPWE